ncbi:MAG: SurA N-terminal domain-containing protein [Candidatus Omnitrophota bacterium]
MLKVLRKKGVMKKILWVIAIVIIISFGFFGTANIMSRGDRITYAGKIFGRKISLEEYQKAYKQTTIQALMQYGKNFYKIKEFLNIESQSWDRLILLEEAKKRNINITNEEVVQAIEKVPFFHRDGQFDMALYNNILRNIFKTQAREFEEGIRDSLKIIKIHEQVTLPVNVSEEETYARFKLNNERVEISYILFPFENFKQAVTYLDPQIEEYHQKNKQKFLSSPAINVAYLSFPFPEGADEAQREKISSDAYNLYDELRAKPDLEQAAKKHNLPVQTTGFFSRTEPKLEIKWPFELLQKALQLEQNQVSEPVETTEGIYILSIKETRNASLPEFSEVKDKVKEAFISDEAKKLAKKSAEEYLAEIQKALSQNKEAFNETAQSLNLSIQKTPVFKRGDYLPNIGISEEFQKAAFALNEENRTGNDVIGTLRGYCILHLDSYVPGNEEEFQEKKDLLAQDLLIEKKEEAFNNFLIQQRLKANLEDNISKSVPPNAS